MTVANNPASKSYNVSLAKLHSRAFHLIDFLESCFSNASAYVLITQNVSYVPGTDVIKMQKSGPRPTPAPSPPHLQPFGLLFSASGQLPRTSSAGL